MPLVTALLLLSSFIKGQKSEGIIFFDQSPLLNIFIPNGISFIPSIIINFLIIIFICFLLLHINAKFSFVKERTFLPVYLFLFITLSVINLHVLNPTIISSVFIILSIQSLFNAFDKKNTIPNLFDASFLIGIAGLFSFYSIVFIMLVPISIFILSGKITWRSIVVPISGIMLPWALLSSLLYVFSDPNILYESVKFALIIEGEKILHSLNAQIYFAYLLLITSFASIFMLLHYAEKSISTRKFFKILFYFFVLSVVLLLSSYASIEIMAIMAIPLVYLLTNYLLLMKRRKWAEIFFTVLIIISIVVQLIE